MKGRIRNIFNDNLISILATIIFHLVLVIIFLTLKITSIQNLIDNIIMIDIQEPRISELIIDPPVEQDRAFDQYVAEYLESERSNVPVNIASKLDEQISTDRFVDDLSDEMSLNKSEEMIRYQERLKELQEMESQADMVAEKDTSEARKPMVFSGKTNIFYSLENRYHLRLPVPVYKCEGSGVVEVQILVDQKGYVVNAQIPDLGESTNEICLAEAAKTAAMNTRFNSNFEAPLRQQGTITYYFQPQ
jgi:hypothetical protein